MNKTIIELVKLHDCWLDEVADRLWYEYFTSVKPHDKATKTFIREQYNTVAAEFNKLVNTEIGKLKILKATDEWENDGLGPVISKKYYVDVLPATRQIVEPPVKSRSKKNQEDEDLLGDAKPAKKPRVKTEGGKGKYDTIAELAAQGMNKDQIQEATGFERKTVTDLLWRYNKLNHKK